MFESDSTAWAGVVGFRRLHSPRVRYALNRSIVAIPFFFIPPAPSAGYHAHIISEVFSPARLARRADYCVRRFPRPGPQGRRRPSYLVISSAERWMHFVYETLPRWRSSLLSVRGDTAMQNKSAGVNPRTFNSMSGPRAFG